MADELVWACRMGRIFPLNSRRITAQILKRIAERLEVAATGSLDEIRVAVDGKLAELGREPRNVQVLIGEESASLADAKGGVPDCGVGVCDSADREG